MSYVLKYRLLLAGSLLLLIASYHLAFKKTFLQKDQYNQANRSMQTIDRAPELLRGYEKELSELKAIIGEHSEDYNRVDGSFFGLISQLAAKHKLQILSLEKPLEDSFEQYRVKTYPVSFEGSFTKVLAMVEQLESESKLGKLVSLEFQVQKDKQKKKVLKSTLYYKIVSSYEN